MIPILFDHFATDFSSNGLGRLEEAVSCTVREVVNGEYELEMQYPMSGRLFQRMLNGGIVLATHDHNGDAQPFDLYAYEAPINGVVTFHAHHVSYRLSNLICGGPTDTISGATPEQVFASVVRAAQTPVHFAFEDYTGYRPQPYVWASYDGYISARDAFLNGYKADDPDLGTQALFRIFPGEFVWDVWTVKYYRRRGSNRGVQIRYGKNMTELTRERSTDGLVTVVYPYWYGGDAPWIYGNPVKSPYAETILTEWDSAGEQMETPDGEPYFFAAADERAYWLDLSGQFQTTPTGPEVDQAARDWLSKNAAWRAYDNITIKFLDLYNSPEYADFAGLETCCLGDYVDVFYQALGLAAEGVEIVSLTYDVLRDVALEMELGDVKPSYADLILKTIAAGGKS